MVEEDKGYPKVIIINSQSMFKSNATGITLRSLFSTWPSDRILEMYRWKPLNYTNDGIAIPSVQIPPKTMPIYYAFRKLLKKECVYEMAASTGTPSASPKNKNSLRKAIGVLIKTASEFTPICFRDKEFNKKIDDFSPDVIYTLGGNLLTQACIIFGKEI